MIRAHIFLSSAFATAAGDNVKSTKSQDLASKMAPKDGQVSAEQQTSNAVGFISTVVGAVVGTLLPLPSTSDSKSDYDCA